VQMHATSLLQCSDRLVQSVKQGETFVDHPGARRVPPRPPRAWLACKKQSGMHARPATPGASPAGRALTAA
jgi:hypothetical protein